MPVEHPYDGRYNPVPERADFVLFFMRFLAVGFSALSPSRREAMEKSIKSGSSCVCAASISSYTYTYEYIPFSIAAFYFGTETRGKYAVSRV